MATKKKASRSMAAKSPFKLAAANRAYKAAKKAKAKAEARAKKAWKKALSIAKKKVKAHSRRK